MKISSPVDFRTLTRFERHTIDLDTNYFVLFDSPADFPYFQSDAVLRQLVCRLNRRKFKLYVVHREN